MNHNLALTLLAAGTAAMAAENAQLSYEELRLGNERASLVLRGKADAYQSVSDSIRNILDILYKEQPND